MTAGPIKLFQLDAIEDNNSNVFFSERAGQRESFIVIKKNGRIFVYINSCPHIGTPLDLAPGRFLTADKSMILCSTHGALFRIEDGFCVFGPCAEQSLSAVDFDIREGTIYLRQ